MTTTSARAFRSARAAAKPPKPAPTMTTRGFGSTTRFMDSAGDAVTGHLASGLRSACLSGPPPTRCTVANPIARCLPTPLWETAAWALPPFDEPCSHTQLQHKPRGPHMHFDKPIRRIAIVGTGVIGASWAAQYLARGLDVIGTDPAPEAESNLR